MNETMLVVFAYDTPDNRRRRRMARALQDVAERVQYSVFEGRLSAAQIETTWRRLECDIDPDEDRVRMYRLCSYCRDAVRLSGPSGLYTVPEYWVV